MSIPGAPLRSANDLKMTKTAERSPKGKAIQKITYVLRALFFFTKAAGISSQIFFVARFAIAMCKYDFTLTIRSSEMSIGPRCSFIARR